MVPCWFLLVHVASLKLDLKDIMKEIILICSLFLLAGCATRRLSTPTDSGSHATKDARYPFSEIENIYDAVLDGMTRKYFSSYPELDKEHTARMREYIAREYPKEKFVKSMLQDKYLPKFEKAMKDPAYRDAEEFKDAFFIVVHLSVSMAKMIIGGQMNIYVAKFIEKDPLKMELFTMAKTEDEVQVVSWVSGEIPFDVVEKETSAAYKPIAGDRVFAFCSPAQTWKDMCGRQGYLIVRAGMIAQVIVTIMN